MSDHDILRAHLLDQCGVSDQEFGGMPDLPALIQQEWSAEFEWLMRRRLVFGVFRYGPLSVNRGRRTTRIENAIRRLQSYLRTGNKEDLVDSANLCMVEYVTAPGTLTAVDNGEHYEFL